MRLEPIGELHLAYGAGGFTRIRPYGTDERSGWGEGDGTIRGDHLSGTVLWANAPHVWSDNTFMPHAHGTIRARKRAGLESQISSWQGRSFAVEGGSGPTRLQLKLTARR